MKGEFISIETLNEIETLKKQNKELKILCNEYEKEHITVFEEWKTVIKKNKELREELSRVAKANIIADSMQTYMVNEIHKIINYIDKIENKTMPICKIKEMLFDVLYYKNWKKD